MIRLFIPLLIAGLVFFPALAAGEEMNSTDEYIVREYALISFSDEISPANSVNVTTKEKSVEVAGTQALREDAMTARKLFELKQAAKEGFYKTPIPRDDLMSNSSGVYTGSNSDDCVAGVCIKKTGYGTFSS
jgi:hypothetical protein